MCCASAARQVPVLTAAVLPVVQIACGGKTALSTTSGGWAT
jgi:hypothetical protein